MTVGQPRKIMVIDDDSDIRVMLFDLLRSEGYEVATFEKPLEALAKTPDFGPDIILLDLRMPKMSGMEVLPLIRQAAPKAGIIIISAYGNWDFYVQAREKGANDLVTKPFCSKVILDKIRQVDAERPAA